MSTNEEAMKLALEAFKEIADETYDSWTNGAKAQRIAQAMISKLEEALAKQEQGEPVGYITNKRQRLNVEIKPNAFVWMPTTTDWEIPLFTVPQSDQDEVDIRSRLYRRIYELEELLRDIGRYTGYGPPNMDWQSLVHQIGYSARSALGEEI